MYGSLAAAQAVYPAATSLTQTLDWAATQLALNSWGGHVWQPAGVYYIESTLSLPSGCHWIGDGQLSTQLNWTNDLGSGQYAVNSVASGQTNAPTITSINFRGPGTYTVGAQTCNMDGLNPSSTMVITDCAVYLFRAGIVFLSDHQKLFTCEIKNNYYGLLWGANPSSKGNQGVYACALDGNCLASICVQGSNDIDSCIIQDTHIGWGPYGMLKTDDPGAVPSTNPMATNTIFQNVAFEYCGAAAVMDQSTGGGGGATTFNYCTLQNPGYSYGGSAYRGSVPLANFVVQTRNVASSTIYGGADFFNSSGGGNLGGSNIGVYSTARWTIVGAVAPDSGGQNTTFGTGSSVTGLSVMAMWCIRLLARLLRGICVSSCQTRISRFNGMVRPEQRILGASTGLLV